MIDPLEYVRLIKKMGREGRSCQRFEVFIVCDMNASVNSIYNNLMSVMKINKCQKEMLIMKRWFSWSLRNAWKKCHDFLLITIIARKIMKMGKKETERKCD